MNETVHETAAETHEPRVLAPTTKRTRRLKIKISDLVVFAVLIAAIIGLSYFIITKVQLKRDVTSARHISDQVITDIQKRDGAAARRLGNAKFQSTYSDSTLTSQFKAIELVTGSKPTIAGQTVGNGKSGKTVLILYKYPAKLASTPYYVQVAVTQQSGKWLLTNISGGSTTDSSSSQ
jgi:hypothetical protein